MWQCWRTTEEFGIGLDRQLVPGQMAGAHAIAVRSPCGFCACLALQTKHQIKIKLATRLMRNFRCALGFITQ